jgi:hypothetical protein
MRVGGVMLEGVVLIQGPGPSQEQVRALEVGVDPVKQLSRAETVVLRKKTRDENRECGEEEVESKKSATIDNTR